MNLDVQIGYLREELEEAQLDARRWRRLACAAVAACAVLIVLMIKNIG